MAKTRIQIEYDRWCRLATADADLSSELRTMTDGQIEDAFYRDLAFGTGGLRGVIGAGTNRMNVYTVAKASQGLADYVLAGGGKKIAVSYDSRIKSDLFARVAAGVFAANGLEVYIYSELMPTPCLSFAVRYLHCDAGVMITASHNPSKYNGYKVYGADGCQITTAAAEAILEAIENIDVFTGVETMEFNEGVGQGKIFRIRDDCYSAFIAEVRKQSVLGNEKIDRNVAIVYSPLNGTGLKPVTRVLRESGFTNLFVVPEQEMPDGHFPTCPYPNPEIREALSLGLEYAKRQGAELMLATDPDCDRVGIAVRDAGGEMQLLTGNEVGMLLLDFICSQRQKNGTMPKDPVMVKTVVTIDMAERIAAHYGVKTVNVLTGFKFIGEQIGLLEEKGEENRYILGFEESYGYLTGTYVRDKDAVDGAFMICEMFAYYKTHGVTLLEKLAELYRDYGYCRNTLHSFEFEGSAGMEKMQKIMQSLRGGIQSMGPLAVRAVLDYATGIDGLPKSDVLKYLLDGNTSVVVRPSGTEPKLKIYVSVCAPDEAAANALEVSVMASLEDFLKA